MAVEHASLFLDLDGTLVGFQNDPGAVSADADCRAILAAGQARLDGRLAILSGRSIASIDEVLGGGVLSVAGVHGLQRRTAAGVVETPPHPALRRAADALEVFAQAERGLRVERKGQSVALHYRQAPSARDAVVELVERIADAADLEVQHGSMVAEIRTPGPDKGSALRAFMADAPFAGTRPIFIGDDLTDEAGFVAAQALGGAGVLVGASRATAAKGRLANADAVRRWVGRSLETGHFDLSEAEWWRRT
jgi:trehalose 6-phosphate phosphatase